MKTIRPAAVLTTIAVELSGRSRMLRKVALGTTTLKAFLSEEALMPALYMMRWQELAVMRCM